MDFFVNGVSEYGLWEFSQTLLFAIWSRCHGDFAPPKNCPPRGEFPGEFVLPGANSPEISPPSFAPLR